jgi:hypothetical protein
MHRPFTPQDRPQPTDLVREAEAQRALAELFPHLKLDALRAIQELFPLQARAREQARPEAVFH